MRPSLLILFFALSFTFPAKAQWKPFGTTFEPSANNEYFVRISSNDSISVWALVQNDNHSDLFARSIDGGKTFQKDTIHSNQYLNASVIWAMDKNTAIIGVSSYPTSGGKLQSLLRTVDGGKTWISIMDSKSNFDFDNIYFFDNNIGIATGRVRSTTSDTIKIFRTIDAGMHWGITNIPAKPLDLSINFIGAENTAAFKKQYWISELSGKLIITNDMGANWEIVDPRLPENRSFDCLAFKDSLNGLGISNFNNSSYSEIDKILFSTKDGGKSWDTISMKFDEYQIIFEIIYNPTLQQWVVNGVDYVGLIIFERLIGCTWESTPDATQWIQNSNTLILDMQLINNTIIGGGEIFLENGFYHWISNVITSIASKENPLKGKIKVYPTAAQNEINLEFNNINSGLGHYAIFDMSGKIIMAKTCPINSSEVLKLSIQPLTSGAYFLAFTPQESTHPIILKFIKI